MDEEINEEINDEIMEKFKRPCNMITDSLQSFGCLESHNILMSCIVTNFVNWGIDKKNAIKIMQYCIDAMPEDEWDDMSNRAKKLKED